MNSLLLKTWKLFFILLLLPTFVNAQNSSKSKTVTGNNNNVDPISIRDQARLIKEKDIASGKRTSDEVIETLSGGSIDRTVPNKLANAYPTINAKNSRTSIVTDNTSNDKNTDEEVIQLSGGEIDRTVTNQLDASYPDIDAGSYDKYEGYINEHTLAGRQLSTQELDKWLAESKRAELISTIKYIGFSIVGLLILWRIVKFINSNKIANSKSEKINKKIEDQNSIADKDISNMDTFFEQMEKLTNLRNSGAITDADFEQFKSKIIKSSI